MVKEVINALKVNHHLLWLFLVFSITPGYSQEYSVRDQEEIAYQAKSTLNMYRDLLNVISYEGLANESEIQELIRNSYTDSRNKIFYSENVIIEDNIKPSNLTSRYRQDKKIKDYLQYFDLAYIKSDKETVEFSDFQVSGLKKADYLFIKVKYTCHFRGKHKEEKNPYKPVSRVAELRAEKQGGNWKTFITSIIYYNPQNPLNSPEGNVKLIDPGTDDGALALLSDNSNNLVTNKGATDPEDSGDHYLKLLERDSLFNLHFTRGRDALEVENFEVALTSFTEAEKINPYNQALRLSFIALNEAKNLGDKSIDERVRIIKSEARKAYSIRDFDEAKKLYSEALALNAEEDSLKVIIELLGRKLDKISQLESHYEQADFRNAIKEYSRAIKKDKTNPDFYFGRGKSYAKVNNKRRALSDYSRAIELDEKYAEALISRAKLHIAEGKYGKAIEDYNLLIGIPLERPDFYTERASLKAKTGDIYGALEDLNEAIELNPHVADFYFEKGVIYLGQKKGREAIRFLSEAIKRNHREANYYYQRGLAYSSLENLDAASKDFDLARKFGLEENKIDEISRLAFKYYSIGEGAMEMNKYRDAAKNYSDAILISPEFGMAWLRKGDAYFLLQEYNTAILNYTNAIEFSPVSLAYFKRAQAYQQKKDYAAATEDFLRFIPIGKEVVAAAEELKRGQNRSEFLPGNYIEDKADAYYALGYSQLMSDQFEEALKNVDKALKNRKFFPQAHFAKGASLYGLGDFNKAIKEMERSIKMGLSEPSVFYSLGKAYAANEKWKDAILSYTHTLKLDPQYEEALVERAVAYKHVREYHSALDDIETVISLNEVWNENALLLTNKGLIELHLNKLTAANSSLDKAMATSDPINPWALYGKASALALENKLEESISLYRKAFQSKEISWREIKNDPLIKPVFRQKEFKDLVKAYL